MLHKKILNQELISLVGDYFEEREVSQEFKDGIFNDLSSSIGIITGKTKMEFQISGFEQQEDMKISTVPSGRIFELIGTNQRFKTTSLIIMAIILNYKFNDAEDMLSSNQLMTRVTQLQRTLFSSNKAKFKLHINNDSFSFKFEKTEDKIVIDFTGGTKEIQLKNQGLLNNELQEYQEFIDGLGIAEVQFVSKGRNFVGFVHKQIREEFVDTLDAIKSNLENIVTQFMNNLPPDYQTTKTELEVKNEITYSKKSLEILEKINIPFSRLNSLINLNKSELCNYSVEQLTDRKLPLIIEKELLEKELAELNEDKKQKKHLIEEHSRILKEYALNTPYKFDSDNLLYTASQFLNEWEELYDAIEISNTHFKDSVTDKLATFTANSHFFGILKINTIEELKELLNKITDTQINLLHIKEYINLSYLQIEGLFSKINELEQSIKSKSLRIISIKEDLEEVDGILELVELLSLYDKKSPVIIMLDNLMNSPDIKYFKHLKQYLDRLKIVYNNETKEKLKPILQRHLYNLEANLEKSSNTLVLPKKIKDIGFMTKFIQDLSAVIEYLSLDEKRYNEEIVNASISTIVHDDIIKLFNEYMAERCKYYFEVKSPTNVVVHNLLNYDFEKKEFLIEGKTVSTSEGISGGTDSAMTVRSFASQKTSSKLGVIMLIDEWGDVGAELASKVYDKIIELPSFGMGIFVKVDYKLDDVILRYMR